MRVIKLDESQLRRRIRSMISEAVELKSAAISGKVSPLVAAKAAQESGVLLDLKNSRVIGTEDAIASFKKSSQLSLSNVRQVTSLAAIHSPVKDEDPKDPDPKASGSGKQAPAASPSKK